MNGNIVSYDNLQKKLDKAEDRAPAQLPDPVEYTEFLVAEIAPPKPIVVGLFDDASRVIFGGGSKTYKTWAMSDLTVSVVSGAVWWGFETVRSRVLYVNFELKPWYARTRFSAIQKVKGVNIPKGVLSVWNLRGIPIERENFKREVFRHLDQTKFDVVVIDPFYTLLGGEGDERISSDLMKVLSVFGELNHKHGVTVVCAAHFAKGNQSAKDPMDRISGGAALNRYPDCLLTLSALEKDGSFGIDIITRDFAPIEPFGVKWSHPLLIPDKELDPSKIKKPAGRTTHYSPEQILEILSENDDELNTTQLQKMVNGETGMSNGKFYELWEQLKNEKKVFRSKVSRKWNRKI